MPITQHAVIHYPLGLLDVGDSFFIPAIGVHPELRKIKKLAQELGIEVDHKIGIDRATNIYGIRIIRVK